jgi:hypothetical protein
MTKHEKTSARRTQARNAQARPTLTVLNPNAAGIDVHSDVHYVCVPADRDSQPVRTFGANSCDLMAIADWPIPQKGPSEALGDKTRVVYVATRWPHGW